MTKNKFISGIAFLLLFGTGLVFLLAKEPVHGAEYKKFQPVKKITKKERDRYYSDSAFIGNSVSLGLKRYFDSSGKGVCGKPVMLVQGCYSFANDKKKGSPYRLTYQGRKYRAKEAIAAAKVERVFINMGSNDLWKPSARTYRDYVCYIKEIRKRNPKVVIFIQGTTPMCSARNRRYLNNSAICDLNKRMEKYCRKQKDIYYVEISKGLKTAAGSLKRRYSSDGYVHLKKSGYKIWTKNLNSYVNRLLLQEKNAALAVDYATEKKTTEACEEAEKWVDRLEDSTVRQELQQELEGLEKKITTEAPSPAPAESPQPPTGPELPAELSEEVSGLRLLRYSDSVVKVIWDRHKGVKYYHVYYSEDKETGYRLAGITKKEYLFVKKLKNRKKYYFFVRACQNKKAVPTDNSAVPKASIQMKKYKRKTVFAGDSICQAVKWSYPSMNIGGKKKIIAYPGLNTVTFHTKRIFKGKTGLEKLIAEKPYRVYMMLGMNEISFRKTGSMIAEYRDLIQMIQQACPDTDIVLCAISPVTKKRKLRYPRYGQIPSFNQRLKNLAKKTGVRYLDYTGFLKNSDGYLKRVYAAKDGCHWKYSAYVKFAKKIEKFEKSIDKN
jgi:hypothetical protein